MPDTDLRTAFDLSETPRAHERGERQESFNGELR